MNTFTARDDSRITNAIDVTTIALHTEDIKSVLSEDIAEEDIEDFFLLTGLSPEVVSVVGNQILLNYRSSEIATKQAQRILAIAQCYGVAIRIERGLSNLASA